MNALETKIVAYCAAYNRLGEYADADLDAIEAEFYFALKTAKDWGQISELPDTVMDICIRSTGIDWVATRGPRVSNPVSPSASFGKLVREACEASNRYLTIRVDERVWLKRQLQSVYLRLGDLVAQEWSRKKR